MMIRSLLFLLVAFTLVIAMVPKNGTHQDTESSTAESDRQICGAQTPCAWSIYKSGFKNLIELNITNTYCVCSPDQYCAFDHEDELSSTYVSSCQTKE